MSDLKTIVKECSETNSYGIALCNQTCGSKLTQLEILKAVITYFPDLMNAHSQTITVLG